jgi:hypothetical protein
MAKSLLIFGAFLFLPLQFLGQNVLLEPSVKVSDGLPVYLSENKALTEIKEGDTLKIYSGFTKILNGKKIFDNYGLVKFKFIKSPYSTDNLLFLECLNFGNCNDNYILLVKANEFFDVTNQINFNGDINTIYVDINSKLIQNIISAKDMFQFDNFKILFNEFIDLQKKIENEKMNKLYEVQVLKFEKERFTSDSLISQQKIALKNSSINHNPDTSQTLKSKTAILVDDDPWKSQLGPKNSYTTIDFNDNNFDKTNKGKKVAADSQSKLPPNIDSALKKLTKSDAYFLLKILDKPDPQNKDGDICGTTTTGCYWCNKRVQISKFYKSRGKELFRTLMINNFGFDLDLKSKINAIRKNGMYYCEANLTWTKYYCSRNCEYLHQKSKKGF